MADETSRTILEVMLDRCAAFLVLVELAACGSATLPAGTFAPEGPDAAVAPGMRDAGGGDVGVETEATDLGSKDLGPDDTGADSEGPPDGGTLDAGIPEVGPGQCHPTLAPCAASEWCEDPTQTCGVGVCRPAPFGCSGLYAPVCGCDGQVYTNACESTRAGVGGDAREGCMPPAPDLTPCGVSFCQPEREVCIREPESPGFDGWRCEPFPAGCVPPSANCDCLSPNLSCTVQSCDATPQGFRVTCG